MSMYCPARLDPLHGYKLLGLAYLPTVPVLHPMEPPHPSEKSFIPQCLSVSRQDFANHLCINIDHARVKVTANPHGSTLWVCQCNHPEIILLDPEDSNLISGLIT